MSQCTGRHNKNNNYYYLLLLLVVVLVGVVTALEVVFNEETNRPTNFRFLCQSYSFRIKKRYANMTLPLPVHNLLCTDLFIYGLFNCPVSVSEYMPLDGRIINKL